MVDVRPGDRLEDLGVGPRVVVGGEATRIGEAHGCSSSRWPFMRPAASEQRYTSASAISSAGVKDGYSLSGFRSRMPRVRIALTTTTLAVAFEPAKESASASVHDSAAAFVAA